MNCPDCQHSNPEGNTLCEDCGASLELKPDPIGNAGQRGSTVTAVTAVKVTAPKVRTTIPHTGHLWRCRRVAGAAGRVVHQCQAPIGS